MYPLSGDRKIDPLGDSNSDPQRNCGEAVGLTRSAPRLRSEDAVQGRAATRESELALDGTADAEHPGRATQRWVQGGQR